MTIIEVMTNTDLVLDNLFPITSKALKMFGIKAVYVYTLVNLFLHICVGGVILIYGLHILNKQFWLEIGIVFIFIFSTILQATANLLFYNIWKKFKIMYASQLSWNFNNISLRTKNKINSLCKRMKISYICSCILIIFASSVGQLEVMPQISHFLQSFKFIATIESYVPFIHPIWIASLTIGNQYMSLLLTMALFYPYYFVALTMIQLYILQDYIETFQRNMPYNKNRHCYVKKCLRKIVKTHHKIWSVYYQFNREKLPIIGLSTFALLLCIMYHTALLYSPYHSTTSPVINFTLTLFAAFYFSGEGQALENLVDDINDSLYNLKWYEWNRENQKTFCTFFGMNRPSRIHGSMNAIIQINNMYFKQVLRMAYTLVNLGRTISHK